MVRGWILFQHAASSSHCATDRLIASQTSSSHPTCRIQSPPQLEPLLALLLFNKNVSLVFSYPQGDAVFWHNMLRSGEGDFRTRHAGCPVLKGWKWGKFRIIEYNVCFHDRNKVTADYIFLSTMWCCLLLASQAGEGGLAFLAQCCHALLSKVSC